MEGIPLQERKRLGALLDTQTQESVMALIPQFHQAETDNFVPAPAQVPKELGVLMFNMERGVNLKEIQEFLLMIILQKDIMINIVMVLVV